jgi:hypothetical protein
MTEPMGRVAAASSDLDEIRALSARYVRHLDDGDPEAAAALFAEDGVWDGSASGLPVRTGRPEILAGFARGVDGPRYIHLSGNHLITLLDADHGEGSEHVMAVRFAPSGEVAFGLSLLRDEYVRTVDGWRFRRRALSSFGRATLSAEQR